MLKFFKKLFMEKEEPSWKGQFFMHDDYIMDTKDCELVLESFDLYTESTDYILYNPKVKGFYKLSQGQINRICESDARAFCRRRMGIEAYKKYWNVEIGTE